VQEQAPTSANRKLGANSQDRGDQINDDKQSPGIGGTSVDSRAFLPFEREPAVMIHSVPRRLATSPAIRSVSSKPGAKLDRMLGSRSGTTVAVFTIEATFRKSAAGPNCTKGRQALGRLTTGPLSAPPFYKLTLGWRDNDQDVFENDHGGTTFLIPSQALVQSAGSGLLLSVDRVLISTAAARFFRTSLIRHRQACNRGGGHGHGKCSDRSIAIRLAHAVCPYHLDARNGLSGPHPERSTEITM